MTTSSNNRLFERLKTGLEEGIAFTQGKIDLKTTEVPETPPEIDAETLTALRKAADMSQAIFARVLNVSCKTVQSWEQGKRVPSMASRRLIQVFSERPEVVCEIVGLRPITIQGFRIVSSKNGHRKIVLARGK